MHAQFSLLCKDITVRCRFFSCFREERCACQVFVLSIDFTLTGAFLISISILTEALRGLRIWNFINWNPMLSLYQGRKVPWGWGVITHRSTVITLRSTVVEKRPNGVWVSQDTCVVHAANITSKPLFTCGEIRTITFNLLYNKVSHYSPVERFKTITFNLKKFEF